MTIFTDAESDPGLSKEQARPLIEKLRPALLKAQFSRLKKSQRSLLIVIAGIDGAGRGASVNLLNEWMDARQIRTLAFGEATPHEQRYPFFWRYWQQLPAKGKTGIVFGSWYEPLLKEAARKSPDQALIHAYANAIRDFETMLARDGVQIVKLWYHLSEKAQKARVDELLSDPETSWQVRKTDIKVRKKFPRLRFAGSMAIALTHQDEAPWHVIPSADPQWRAVATGQAVLAAMRQTLPRKAKPDAPSSKPIPDRLGKLDYTAKLDDDEYHEQLAAWQARLARLVRHDRFNTLPVLLVFEGQDAAGKDGAIRRITHALDARQFDAMPIAAPSAAELAHPYLWRFWRNIPPPGKIAIFDRSWYGRVLVERVEHYAAPADWQRAYGEINQFEAQLLDSRAVVLKFWLAVTKDEQLRRFHDREKSPFKAFKITPDDWRNRKKWDDYLLAANEMFARTDTEAAPWHLVAADDKKHARVAVLERVVLTLEKTLGVKNRPSD